MCGDADALSRLSEERIAVPVPPVVADPPAAVAALARSGIMALTGWPAGPPLLPAWQLAGRLTLLTSEIYQLTARQGRPVRVSWEAAVAGRAALLGLRRQGQTSPNGSCRLLATPDGWVALNLPRPTDADLLPALTGRAGADGWADAQALASVTPARQFAERARLLGLATAPLASPSTSGPPGRSGLHPGDPAPQRAAPAGLPGPAGAAGGYTTYHRWGQGRWRPDDPWRVVDLSSLWAGPLVARVLAEAGAAVTKLEAANRPDGARATPRFYEWLHPPTERVVRVDLDTGPGRRRAAALIDAADVVVEASRPRALEQLGLGPDDRPPRPGRVWLSITGHGRDAPGRDWIAFGDDAAVAGGLVAWDPRGHPVFCGDAIADPLTGLTGALAVLGAREAGGGFLIDMAMSRAAAAAAAAPAAYGPPGFPYPGDGSGDAPVVEPDGKGGWRVRVGRRYTAVGDGPEGLDLILPEQRERPPLR